MATIKPIEGRTIHQIQSGQVIVDLCSVVKELLENSLDAGATNIEIRFKNQGLDSIEVQDNGSGITPQNFETVALKHHTSKLSTYSDLTTLRTFGFRGEALSSLCALSYFTITTCLASDAPKGAKLDFETSGKLRGASVIAAQKGTTVTVENLFYNLPVRRRELERNIKREWNRVVGLLGQYACIQTGVKISVTHQPLKGKTAMVFSTKGNPLTKENIINVFGTKTLAALLELNLRLELEPTSGPGQRWSTQDDGQTREIYIVGHISRPAFGEGRQTPDRQMFFVNARPCGLPQVAKAFNEVYKSYNSSQSPFIFANIEMDTNMYDVNVSPDKRTILLHDQTRMLEELKTSLTAVFESQEHTVPISQLPAHKLPSYQQLKITHLNSSLDETRQTAADKRESEDDEDESGKRANTDEDTDGDILQKKPKSFQKALCRASLNGHREADSLLSNRLATRNTGKGSNHNKADLKAVDEEHPDSTKEKRGPAENVGKENSSVLLPSHTSLVFKPSTDKSLLAHELELSVQLPEENLKEPSAESDVSSQKSESPRPEEPIPAIRTPVRHSVCAVVGPPRSAVRPIRTPNTTATIKIGNHTVTSTLGSPQRKKPQIGETGGKLADKLQRSSFGSRLSKRFAAGITDNSNELNDDEGENKEESLLSTQEASDRSDSPENSDTEDINEAQVVEADSENQDTSALALDEDPTREYLDEGEKKAREETAVQKMIEAVEEDTARRASRSDKRAYHVLKGGTKKKDATVRLVQICKTSIEKIDSQIRSLNQSLSTYLYCKEVDEVVEEAIDSSKAEEVLSLTVKKSDFANMKIVGQFNLGFILATRTLPPDASDSDAMPPGDDLFIIDQHASDEKYNFERLQATTLVQTQHMARPKTLDLTAVEEEIVIENQAALEKNGFKVIVDESGNRPVGQRCQLVSLPVSRETTFSLSDLEELLSLLAEHPSGSVPRPSKVRKMFAMRACRSSIMIGKTLTPQQMGKVVKHMGEIDKPWNCPHGRPTMRHLCNLGAWDKAGWKEGDSLDGDKEDVTDWATYRRKRREVNP